MPDVSPHRTGLPNALSHLRLPLLALGASLLMGSGWGNPGCGQDCGGPDEICSEDCDAVAGRYALTFEDLSPLGPDCESLGLTLPTELVLTRNEPGNTGIVSTAPQNVTLMGDYLPYYGSFSLEGASLMRRGTGPEISVSISVKGDLTTFPEQASDPAIWKGTYEIREAGSPPGPGVCNASRLFTAKR